MTIEDNGAPGSNDRFGIAFGSYSDSGQLGGGKREDQSRSERPAPENQRERGHVVAAD